MIFNSTTFAIFFGLFYAVYWFAVPAKQRNLALLIGSYVFYGWWDWRFLGLIALSTGVDFMLGRAIHDSTAEERRRRLLWTSVGMNLGVLGLFKYADFFSESATEVAASLGLELSSPTLEVLLPVGISFYTFQTMSYTFDVYRRRISACEDLITFATYVAFFPQLVAGPIERANRLMPILTDQLGRRRPVGARRSQALSLIVVGLFKKIVIADGVAPIVNEVFADPTTHGSVAIWYAMLGFAIQIYGDFAGYTDIARGVAALLGVELVVNFREPYLSRNITEFWRRWHISLSDWLRDYLYIPLGGNQRGPRRTLINLMLTMLLGGLWHGASWNFVLWGGVHGAFLIVHRLIAGGRVPDGPVLMRDLGRVVSTFVVVMVAWVPFRAASLSDTVDVLSRALDLTAPGTVSVFDLATVLFLTALVLAIDLSQRRSNEVMADATVKRTDSAATAPALAAAVVGLIVFSGGAPAPFIYFQF